VGEEVTLFAAASDVNNDALTYAWNLGDGTVAAGAFIAHTYGAVGTYTATVTVTDTAGASASATVAVTVVAATIGGPGLPPPESPAMTDIDGDGFPDSIELAAGTSPTNGQSTPTGSKSPPPLPLPDGKLAIKLNVAKPGNDSVALAGTLVVAEGVSLGGQTISVVVGGVAKSFALNAKGSYKSGGDSVKVASKGLGSRTAKFAIKMTKGSFATLFADYGLTDTTVKGQPVAIPIVLLFGDILYAKDQQQLYTAKQGKGGSTKDVKK
jgi:hypothetical protein